MPANRGLGGPHWNPSPDFNAPREAMNIDDALQDYEPASVEECAEFLNGIGFPDLDVYDGHPEVRATIASYTAEHIFTPGVPIVKMMELYRLAEADPVARQDYEHDRAWTLLKVEKELARKQQLADGKVIEAAGRFALGSRLDLVTGVSSHNVTKVPPAERNIG